MKLLRKSISFLVLLFIGAAVFGQNDKKFVFANTLDDTSRVKIDYSLSGRSYFGDIIARKLYLLEKTYTYVEKGTPMSPSDKTIVQKPTIFYALKKLTKYYKKQVKKGHLTMAEAVDKLIIDLDKGYAIFSQDTNEFEDYLRQLKKPEDIADAFDKVELK